MPRSNPYYDRCTDSSSEMVAAYRSALNRDDPDCSLAIISYRGGQTEFDLGRCYASSADPLDRITGADVLAQLGWDKRSFLKESVKILVRLLSDSEDRVVAAAASGLGHRNDPAAIPPVLKLITHPNADVRFGVTMALSKHDDESAIAGLIQLSTDENNDVRNWAAFGLGTQTDLDSVPLRDALARLLSDADPEIRGEAMIGLARRHDERAYPAVLRELEGEFYGSWPLEAVELLNERSLLPAVKALRSRLHEEECQQFADDFDRAEKACGF